MSLLTSFSLKTLAGAGSAVVVVGGGTTIAYVAIPSSNKSDWIGRDINASEEVAKKRKLKVVKAADTANYVFVLASVTSIDRTTSNLYTSDNKNFQCTITGEDEITTNEGCDIYQINKGGDSSTISFENNVVKKPIKDKGDLTINKHVIVKVPTAFKEKLSKEKPNFQFASSNDPTIALIELKWEFDLNKDHTNQETPITQSSLMVIKLTEDATFDKANSTDNSYSCFLGNEDTAIDCKVYIPTNPEAQYTQETLKSIGAISTESNAAQGNYLIIDLKSTKKYFHELDNKHIVVKNSSSEQIAKGILDNLLIGVIDDNSTTSLLFKLKNIEGRNSNTYWDDQNHIITKYVGQHLATPSTFDHANVVCRLVEDGKIYQDDVCSVYQFGGDEQTNFDQKTFAQQANKVNAASHLTTGKYQVVKTSQSLIDKLAASSTKRFEIIPSHQKTLGFNNSFIQLEMKQILTSGAVSKPIFHSKLFVAKVKEQKSAAQSESNAAVGPFKCVINAVEVDCNVYKFAGSDSTPRITKETFSTIENSITPSSDLVKDKYVVIELTAGEKSFIDLATQAITLKNSSAAEYATLNFEQQIFGYIDGGTKYGLPITKKQVSFIVAKTPAPHENWSTENISDHAVCKYKTDNGVESFDNTCRLIKIPGSGSGKKLVELKEIHDLNPKTKGGWNLKDDDDGFYKLIFDANMLHNLDLNRFENQTITLELPSTTVGGTKTYGSVQLKQKIEGENSFTGNARMLLVQYVSSGLTIYTDPSMCEFQRYFAFKCSLYKGLDSSKAIVNNIDNLSSFTEVTDLSETLATNGYYLIKDTDPLNNNLKNTESIIYLNQEKGGTIKNQMFMIKKIIVGNLAEGKPLYNLKTISE